MLHESKHGDFAYTCSFSVSDLFLSWSLESIPVDSLGSQGQIHLQHSLYFVTILLLGLYLLWSYQTKPMASPAQYLILPSPADAWYFCGWRNLAECTQLPKHYCIWEEKIFCCPQRTPAHALNQEVSLPFFFLLGLIRLPMLLGAIKFSSQHLSQQSSCGCKSLCSAVHWTQLHLFRSPLHTDPHFAPCSGPAQGHRALRTEVQGTEPSCCDIAGAVCFAQHHNADSSVQFWQYLLQAGQPHWELSESSFHSTCQGHLADSSPVSVALSMSLPHSKARNCTAEMVGPQIILFVLWFSPSRIALWRTICLEIHLPTDVSMGILGQLIRKCSCGSASISDFQPLFASHAAVGSCNLKIFC